MRTCNLLFQLSQNDSKELSSIGIIYFHHIPLYDDNSYISQTFYHEIDNKLILHIYPKN